MSYPNVAVIAGRLSQPARTRLLPSGDRLVALEVTVPGEGRRAEGVPVVWLQAPGWVGDLDTGAGVLAVGRVRRRFWRRGAQVAATTEVVADTVVPLDEPGRCRAAALDALGRAEEALAGGTG